MSEEIIIEEKRDDCAVFWRDRNGWDERLTCWMAESEAVNLLSSKSFFPDDVKYILRKLTHNAHKEDR